MENAIESKKGGSGQRAWSARAHTFRSNSYALFVLQIQDEEDDDEDEMSRPLADAGQSARRDGQLDLRLDRQTGRLTH